MSVTRLRCFKAYDVRGRVPEVLNEDIAYRIARALVEYLSARKLVVGRDLRFSGLALEAAFCRGITDAGADAHCLGVCGTEEVYFATAHSDADGGAMITASHNPISDNGIKMVREGARPISRASGLLEIQSIAEAGRWRTGCETGVVLSVDYREAYIRRMLSFVAQEHLTPLAIVTNAGNTSAGHIMDLLAPHLPFEFIKLNHNPDGRFPKGVPNPMLAEHRVETSEAVRATNADFGIAWDGDFDRCFFFDERGMFVEGYYVVGLLAEYLLSQERTRTQRAVVHDARLVWNTEEVVGRAGGRAVCSKAGHSFMKDVMREENAVYGGEMSAHHYFCDFFYCDSGMVPWLILAQLLSGAKQSLSELLRRRQSLFPISGELNCPVRGDVGKLLNAVEARYAESALSVERLDGISISYRDWRFNVRASNTEPVVRLNIETRADTNLLKEKTAELLSTLCDHG